MEFKFVVKVKAEEKEFEIPVNLSKMLELLQSCLSKELTKEIEKVVEEKDEDEDDDNEEDNFKKELDNNLEEIEKRKIKGVSITDFLLDNISFVRDLKEVYEDDIIFCCRKVVNSSGEIMGDRWYAIPKAKIKKQDLDKMFCFTYES